MEYIEQQKNSLKRKNDYACELQKEVSRMADRQTHYSEVQRPKLLAEIGSVKQVNQQITDEIQKLKMENSLVEITLGEENRTLKALIATLETKIDSQKE